MRKRMFGALLTSLALVLFVGCTADDKKAASNDTAGTVNPEGYPIVKDKLTMKVMGAKQAVHGQWENLAFFKEMEKLTNIHLEFNVPPAASWNEKKNLAFASGDIPDFFYGGDITIDDIVTYGRQGVLIPIEGLIEKHAPNIKKMFKDYPDIKASLTAPDGHIYALSTVTMQNRTLYGQGFWMDPDLRDSMGIKTFPKNTNEFYELLKTLKQKGLIPLSGSDLKTMRRPMLAAFGLRQDEEGVGLENNKVIFAPADPRYKEYLMYMNRLYSEKLLDNAILSHTNQEYIAKGKSGQLGVFTSIAPNQNLTITLQDVVKKRAPMFPPMTSPANDKPVWPTSGKVGRFSFAITKKDPNPAATIRWIDFLYGTRGAILSQFGEMMDEEFMKDPSKKYEAGRAYKDVKTQNTNEYINHNLTIFSTPRYIGKEYFAKLDDEPHVAYFNEITGEYLKNEHAKEAFPLVSFTVEEREKLKTMLADILTYTEEMEAKFIAGQESFNNWNNYVNTLNKMKYQDMVKIYQTAFDRWNKSK